MNWLTSTQGKWTLFGIIFGSLFPIAGTIYEINLQNFPFSWKSIVLAQSKEPILWIVDLAPIILGILFNIIGNREQELQHKNSILDQTNQQLIGLQSQLEQGISERTSAIELANRQLQRRAEQFEAIAQISKVISSIQNQEDLLNRVTHMISQSFGFYHVGIFLLDEKNQYAILRAANSEGGEKMLSHGHNLVVGQTGIVGLVTSTGTPRVTLDTGTDSFYFDNPNLPDTRSEMALPLKIGTRVIGALDVQSTEPNAFFQEDINILSVLADQVSTALENARLHEEAREALSRAENAYRQVTGEAWSDIRRFTPVLGYHYDGFDAKPLNKPKDNGQTGPLNEAYTVPVQLRGASIGRLRVSPPLTGHQLTESEIAIIQATAERVALAIENARLVLESQNRAAKEQIIGQITGKIGSSINLRNVLQTAVEELGKAIPGSEIVIKLENDRK